MERDTRWRAVGGGGGAISLGGGSRGGGHSACRVAAAIPYCHEWFEDFFSECNIELLGAFDQASFGLSSGFGISMDQQDLWSAQQCGGCCLDS